jgi:hypothetical protein
MVSVLASSPVDRGFEPRSGQTKDYKISICCFSAKHAALRRKSKDWLARKQENLIHVLTILNQRMNYCYFPLNYFNAERYKSLQQAKQASYSLEDTRQEMFTIP